MKGAVTTKKQHQSVLTAASHSPEDHPSSSPGVKQPTENGDKPTFWFCLFQGAIEYVQLIGRNKGVLEQCPHASVGECISMGS